MFWGDLEQGLSCLDLIEIKEENSSTFVLMVFCCTLNNGCLVQVQNEMQVAIRAHNHFTKTKTQFDFKTIQVI